MTNKYQVLPVYIANKRSRCNVVSQRQANSSCEDFVCPQRFRGDCRGYQKHQIHNFWLCPWASWHYERIENDYIPIDASNKSNGGILSHCLSCKRTNALQVTIPSLMRTLYNRSKFQHSAIRKCCRFSARTVIVLPQVPANSNRSRGPEVNGSLSATGTLWYSTNTTCTNIAISATEVPVKAIARMKVNVLAENINIWFRPEKPFRLLSYH